MPKITSNKDLFLAKKHFTYQQANSEDVFHLHALDEKKIIGYGAVFTNRTKHQEPRHMGNITGLTNQYLHLRIYLMGQRFDYKIRFDEMVFLDENSPITTN